MRINAMPATPAKMNLRMLTSLCEKFPHGI